MNANRPAAPRGASRVRRRLTRTYTHTGSHVTWGFVYESRFRPYVVPLRMDSTSVTTMETFEELEDDVSHANQPSKSDKGSGSSVHQSGTDVHASCENSGDSQTQPPANHEASDFAQPRSCGTSVAHDCSPCAEDEGKIKQESVSPELKWSRPPSASPGPSVKQEEA